MDRLRASGGASGPVPGGLITQLLANLPTEQSVPLASSSSLIGSMSEAGSWVVEPSVGLSTAAASVPNPTVPHHRIDTPSATEMELPSVVEDCAEVPAPAQRESSPAPSGSVIGVPNIFVPAHSAPDCQKHFIANSIKCGNWTLAISQYRQPLTNNSTEPNNPTAPSRAVGKIQSYGRTHLNHPKGPTVDPVGMA